MADITISVGLDTSEAEAGAKRLRTALGTLETAQRQQQQRQSSQTQQQKTLKADIDRTSEAFDRLARATRLVDGPLGGVASRFQTLNAILKDTKGAFVSVTVGLAGFGFAIGQLLQQGEKMTRLTNNLKLVAREGENLTATQEKLFAVANRARGDVEQLSGIYSKYAKALEGVNVSQAQLFRLTETTAKAVALSGATAQSASAALYQFGQALGSGVLRGEELNSVLEQTPELARTIARGLDIPLKKLREFANEGKLSTDKIVLALTRQQEAVDAAFGKLAPTVSSAMTVFNNQLTEAIGKLDQSAGFTRTLAKAIQLLGENLGPLLQTLNVLGQVLLVRLVLQFGMWVQSMIAASVAAEALAARTAAMAAANLYLGTSSATAAVGVSLLARAGAFLMANLPIIALTAVIIAFQSMKTESEETAERIKEFNQGLSELDNVTAKLERSNYDLSQSSGERRLKLEEETKALRENATAELNRLTAKQTAAETELKLLNARSAQLTNSVSDRGIFSNFFASLYAGFGGTSDAEKLGDVQQQSTEILKIINELIDARQRLEEAIGGGTGSFGDSDAEALSKKMQEFRKELELSVEQTHRLTDAVNTSKKAYEAESRAIEAENALIKAGYTIKSKDWELLKSMIIAREQELDLIKAKLAVYDTDQEARDAERLLKANQQSAEQREKMERILEAEQAVRQANVELESEAGKQIYDNVMRKQQALDADKKITEERRKQEREVEAANRKLERSYERVAERIQEGFSDAFYQIFRNGTTGFENLADRVKDIFARMLAEMAVLAISQPIIVPIIQGIGSAMGLSSSTIGNVTSRLGMGDAASLANMVGGNSIFKGLGSSIDAFGAQYLGMANVSPSFVGPLLPGQTAGMTLSGALGAAGIGAGVGGIVASLTGGNAIGGSIGGAGGAMIGQALIPIPGVGALIGGALGGGLGGLFGPGKPNPAASFSGTLSSGGALESVRVLSKHIGTETADALAKSVGAITATLGAAGINLGGIGVAGGYDVNRPGGGGFFDVNGQRGISFDPKDEAQVDRALGELIVELTKVADVTNTDVVEALKHLQTEGKTAQEVLDQISFAASLKMLQQDFLNSLTAEYIDIVDPQASAVLKLMMEYQAELKKAQTLGIGIVEIERNHKEKLLRLAQQVSEEEEGFAQRLKDDLSEAKKLMEDFSRAADNIRKTIQDLKFSAVSPLSPQERYSLAKSQFETTANMARLGNLEAAQNLPELAKTFLEESQSYFGRATLQGGTDFNSVMMALEQAAVVSENAANSQQNQVTLLEQQLAQLQSINQNTLATSTSIPNMGTVLLEGFTALAMSNGQPTNTSSGPVKNMDQVIGRALGFTGEYGGGAFTTWLDQNNLTSMFTSLQSILGGGANQNSQPSIPNPNRNWGNPENRAFHEALVLATGYTGDFGGGGWTSWIPNQPESVKAPARAVYDRFGRQGAYGFQMGGLISEGMIAKVHPGEMIYTGPQARVYNPRMYGSMAANDNRELIEELRLNREMIGNLVMLTYEQTQLLAEMKQAQKDMSAAAGRARRNPGNA